MRRVLARQATRFSRDLALQLKAAETALKRRVRSRDL